MTPQIETLLDTDVMIELLRDRPAARAWATAHAELAIGIPVVVRMEIIQGARDRREQDRLRKRLDNFETCHIKTGDSVQALKWFESYRLSHNVGILDCLIAAIATRLGTPLFTFNLKHYRVIPGLTAKAPY